MSASANVSVAEILDFQTPTPIDDVPNWCLGFLAWRDIQVPLVSFEGLNDQPIMGSASTVKIVIMNGVTNGERMPFWGLVSQGTPRLMRVTGSELLRDETRSCGPAELMAVKFGSESAHIPDTDLIEKELLALKIF